ncbi:MAG: ABC transporter substrate-binding protein [Firmicutes bacterium]|nr:ABC transporter substrate-binding protein [Bacillota bacterium]
MRGSRRRRRGARSAAVALAAILLVALAGLWLGPCRLGPAERTHDYRTWHGALAFEPGPLDPARAATVTDGAMISLVYSNLLSFDADGSLVSDLASDWEVTPDGLVYTFHLRPGVRFQDGTSLEASDVVFSFTRILDPRVGSCRAWVLDGILGAREFLAGRVDSVAGLEAPDPLTVRVTLDKPLAHFPALLAMPAAAVVSPEAAARWGPDLGYHPVGTGPWRLVEWREGVRLVFERNPDYFGTPPRLERLVFRIIPDAATRQAEFEAGNLEVLVLGEENADYFARHPRYGDRLVRVPELAVVYMCLNCSKPPLDNVLVRRALNHAIDRRAILEAVRPGRYILADGSVPPGLAGHESAWPGYAYDPSLARTLLARAGYPEGFEMDLVIRAGGLAVFLAEPIQAELARAGVRLSIVQLETQAFFAAVGDSGNPDSCLLSWVADYADPENFLFPLFYSKNPPSAGNTARFADPVVDRLLEEIHREMDPARRAVLCQAAERAVFEQAPWVPLFFPVDLVVCQPEVRGWRVWSVASGNKMTEVWLEPAGGEP